MENTDIDYFKSSDFSPTKAQFLDLIEDLENIADENQVLRKDLEAAHAALKSVEEQYAKLDSWATRALKLIERHHVGTLDDSGLALDAST